VSSSSDSGAGYVVARGASGNDSDITRRNWQVFRKVDASLYSIATALLTVGECAIDLHAALHAARAVQYLLRDGLRDRRISHVLEVRHVVNAIFIRGARESRYRS